MRTALAIVLLLVGAGAAVALDVRPNAQFAQKASWKMPTVANVREQAVAWATEHGIDDNTRAQVDALWTSAADGSEAHLLDLLAATFALVDPRARELLNHCSQARLKVTLPNVEWLGDEKTPPLVRNNLRLLYGRWLVQERLYDEGTEQLAGLNVEDVADPAALLFYTAVLQHRTLQRDAGLKTIARLLENEPQLPKRFASLAKLMEPDLKALKDDSLDHIARRMDDIRRRLDLGRAGPKVRSVEDGVIASLDKLIDDMEKQQQAAAAAAAASGGGKGGLQPNQPAPDSTPMQGKGPGEVTKKPIGNSSGWGELPPRQRQEALQQIGKDYPAHYRDMIEQYFRKLASEEEAADK